MSTTDEPSKPITSLVVASRISLRETVGFALQQLGHRVSRFASARGVWAAHRRKHFDLVILQWGSQARGVAELVRRLDAARQGGFPLLLALVEGEQEGEATAAMEAGADDFLRLPASAGVLALRLRGAARRIAGMIEHRRALAALQESERRWERVAAGANDGLWEWNLVADCALFSTRWKALLGYEDGEIGTSPDEWFGRVHPDDAGRLRAAITAHLAGLSPALEIELRMFHKDGACRWMLVRGAALRGADEPATRLAGSLTDVTDRRRAEQRLAHDALHDSLTGLPNRALFMDRLSQAYARAMRPPFSRFAVCFVDVDRFKLINDSLGHPVGDQLLIALARRLEASLRPGDTVARLGGDEFAVLMEDVEDVRQTTTVAERILTRLRAPLELAGQEVVATASFGIAFGPGANQAPEDFLRDADTAMYRAKAQGRDCYVVFDQGMHDSAVAALQLENELRHAIEHGEFCVHYQPIITLEHGRIAGFEALVRWSHPRRGLILPADFIPLAEETGLIVPIDRWVTREACRQIRNWLVRFRNRTPLTVSVNISGNEFLRPDLIMEIDGTLRQFGLYGDTLRLEITESMMMEKARYAEPMLEQLRALAIKLSIDDFGTGYSSLAYLRRFEIDTLKIDASFVGRMTDDADAFEIVRNIISLARNLGKDVIAEGVETPAQLERLRDLRCTFGQGFLFARPLDGETATRLIASNPKW
jgi:diguanylate cyclase (GGDEF)-like protein/PAS domain S-box-containing protein